MNYRYTFTFLIIVGTSFSMEKPKSSISHGSKSHVIRPSRPVLKGSVISQAPMPRHQSTKELSQSVNKKIGTDIGTDLMAAINSGAYDTVKGLLMTQDSAANFVTESQETPLYAALMAKKYNHKIFSKLLAYRADLNRPVNDKTPFEIALEKNNKRAALRLIYAGARVEESKKKELLAQELFYQLSRVPEKIKMDQIRYLLSYFDSVNFHSSATLNNIGNEDTPLLCTIKEPKYFNKTVFEEVLQKSDVNTCARNGLSPLYKAVLFDNEEAALHLLMEKADYNYVMPYYKEKPLSIRELAEQMNMTSVVRTIDTLREQAKAGNTANKDELVAQLVRQTTPRRTTSPRVAVQKP